MHQPWLFEPRRFLLENDETYLPDFWLEAQRAWLEVKPVYEPDETAKQALFAREFEQTLFVAIGPPSFAYDKPTGQLLKCGTDGRTYSGYRWRVCDECGTVRIASVLDESEPLHRSEHHVWSSTGSRLFTATVLSKIWEF